MAKDSQLDPKEVRKMKAKGGHTMAESAPDFLYISLPP